MIENLFTIGLTAAFSATPVSLLMVNQISKVISKHHPELGKTTTICTEIDNILTKPTLKVKTILFDKYRAKLDLDNDFAKIEDLEHKEDDLLLEKQQFVNDRNLQLMATANILAPFEKTKKVEEVVIKFLKECGFNEKEIKEKNKILQKIPTNKDKRYSTLVIQNKERNEVFALTKGNPLKILKKCKKAIINGRKIEIDPHTLRKLRKKIDKLNKSGQKVIGYAQKPLPIKILDHYTEGFAESEMTYIGVIGTRQPLDREVIESAKIAQNAGIKNYILTSKKEKNTVAIGIELGLVNQNYFESITGDYLRQLTDKKIGKILHNKEKDVIFCELLKDDKIRIMKLLTKDGEVIARPNPRYQSAYTRIIEGIERGRRTNQNSKKYSDHAIACKIGESILLITTIALKAPLALSISLIISLDIFINLLLELSLKEEPVRANVMTEKYHPLQRRSSKNLIFTGVTIGTIISAVYVLSLIRYGWEAHSSISISDSTHMKAITTTFLTLFSIQIISALSLRKKRKSIFKLGILNNIYITLTVIISALLLYILTNFKIAQEFFNITSLSILDWQIIAFLAITFLLIEEFKKYIIRNAHSKNSKKRISEN